MKRKIGRDWSDLFDSLGRERERENKLGAEINAKRKFLMEEDNHREGEITEFLKMKTEQIIIYFIGCLETSSGLGFTFKEKRISKDKNKLESKKTYKDKIKGIIVQNQIKALSVGKS